MFYDDVMQASFVKLFDCNIYNLVNRNLDIIPQFITEKGLLIVSDF